MVNPPGPKASGRNPAIKGHPATIRAFQRRILKWYKVYGRDLPWRKTRDPYKILVSEIMLQQTQVSRVLLYYENFLETFPTAQKLANAPVSAVQEAWSGLGYYARAQNLHKTVRYIVQKQKGNFPNTAETLRTLPGIGPYTAGAVSSFAFHRRSAILDTNVARVLRRFFDIPANLQSSKELWQLARLVTPKRLSHIYNQAIMDVGATLCVARNPRCDQCPVKPLCRTRRNTMKSNGV